jgi:hypothetical protein
MRASAGSAQARQEGGRGFIQIHPSPRQRQAAEHPEGDENIGSGVERIGEEKVAPEPASGTGFEPDDPDVHRQGEDEESEGRARDVQGRGARHEAGHSAADELEDRERQQQGDEQSTKRLELGMSIRVILVGRLGGYPYHENADEIIGRVD